MNDAHTPDPAPDDPLALAGHEASGADADGPGTSLRQARETQRLTREDVARQLHLDVRLVVALEEDDYRHMPAPIFVSGYLRSYARLLKLPEDEILAAYDGDVSQPDLLPNIAIKSKSRGRDALVRVVTYGLILGLVALLLLWWFGVGKSRRVPPPTTAPTASVRNAVPAPTAAETPAEPADSHPATPTTDTPGSVSSVQAAPAPAPTRLTGMDANAPRSPAGGAVPAGAAQHLSLHYTADSWTEVQDATGRQLVYRLIKAGETLELSGVAPFNVVLGYAPGVAIEYNGQPFDKGHANTKEVAHFVVGKAAAPASKTATGGND